MTKKKPLLLFIAILIIASVPMKYSTSINNQQNIKCQWIIDNWNEQTLLYWYPLAYVNASVDSLVNYTLSYYDPSNVTYPSAGLLEIGNFSVETTNENIASTLTLSIWGWFPGLVTFSSNWTKQQTMATEAANGEWTKGTVTYQNITFQFGEYFRKAINFTYNQDPAVGNQNTSLVYDIETGVLLKGYTEVAFASRYVLGLTLSSCDIISTSNVAISDTTILQDNSTSTTEETPLSSVADNNTSQNITTGFTTATILASSLIFMVRKSKRSH